MGAGSKVQVQCKAAYEGKSKVGGPQIHPRQRAVHAPNHPDWPSNALPTSPPPHLAPSQSPHHPPWPSFLPPTPGAGETLDQLYAFFLERVRTNLHVILCLSPVGEAFRERCRMFPGLVNCTTIDWYARTRIGQQGSGWSYVCVCGGGGRGEGGGGHLFPLPLTLNIHLPLPAIRV